MPCFYETHFMLYVNMIALDASQVATNEYIIVDLNMF